MLKNGIFCGVVILVVFKVFLVVKNLEILTQIVQTYPYIPTNAVNKFIKAILKEYNYCGKVIKKHFNKNLIMSAEEDISII